MDFVVVPHPKLKRDYAKRKIRTVRELRNGFATIPIGKIGMVESYSPKGANIVFDACQCCGMKVHISQIKADDIEFVEEAKQ